jgi:hypothetical protein
MLPAYKSPLTAGEAAKPFQTLFGRLARALRPAALPTSTPKPCPGVRSPSPRKEPPSSSPYPYSPKTRGGQPSSLTSTGLTPGGMGTLHSPPEHTLGVSTWRPPPGQERRRVHA